MKQNIVNLTNYLIGKYGFDLMFSSMKSRDMKDEWKEIFVKLVCDTISSRDVREMSPEKLGTIFCSIEGSEYPCKTPALYFGKPEQYLRDTVSDFLAWSICYRLDEDAYKHHGNIPPYVSKTSLK